METVQFQSYVFSYSVYGGILIGILYDFYRVIRRRKRNERLITSFWDVLFIISVFIVAVWAIFSSSYGDIRLYVLIGFVVGFYLYEKLLGRIAAAILNYLFRSISGFFKKTNNLLVLPIKLLVSFIYQCCSRFMHYLGRKRIKLRKVRKLPRQIIEDTKKYSRLIVRKKRNRI
jgi:spore cortex biosynthesis protein YabQ